MSAETGTPAPPAMLPLREAAPILNIPVSTLRRLCAKRLVPSEKVGRCWRVKGAYIASVTSYTPEKVA